MVAHRPLGQVQRRRDVRDRPPSPAVRSTSVSQRVSGLSPAASVSAARLGSTTRSPEATRRTASASCRAGVSLTTKPLAPAAIARRRYRPAERGHDQHAAGWQRGAEFLGGADPVQAGHLDVQQGHVGPGAARLGHYFVAPADFGHHFEVRLQREQRGQCAADQGLVVGEQQADRSAR